MEAFENESNFVINEQVEVFATPGHTLDSVSVSVKSSKGGLISERFSLWLKSPNKDAKSLSCAISHWCKFGTFIWRFEPK